MVNYPESIWCQNDVVSTSMRCHIVASTLIQHFVYTMCPLGAIPLDAHEALGCSVIVTFFSVGLSGATRRGKF